MVSTSFSDFYNDDNNVSPAEREEIESEVELMEKLIEEREANGVPQEQPEETASLSSLVV